MISTAGAGGFPSRCSPLSSSAPVLAITREGLVLAGTVLAKAGRDCHDRLQLALDGAEERILALLATVYGRTVGPALLGKIRGAAAYWNQGETVLAAIQLARAGLPPLADEGAASLRLGLGEKLLANGLSPQELPKACGLDPAAFDLRRAGYNPRVPAGSPDGGQWTDDGSEAGRQKDPTPSMLVPANYTPVHELPFDAKAVIPPDGVPILDPDSPTKFLMAPSHADFQEVYNAGRAIKSLPLVEQYARARTAIAQEGTYDFQRDVPRQKFYDPYVPAANYAVGVYMAGAGIR